MEIKIGAGLEAPPATIDPEEYDWPRENFSRSHQDNASKLKPPSKRSGDENDAARKRNLILRPCRDKATQLVGSPYFLQVVC